MSAKSTFVTLFIMGSMAAGIWSAWMMYSGHPWLPWAGAALATLPMPALIQYLFFTQSVRRTSQRMPIITGLSVLGLVLALLPLIGVGGSDSAPVAIVTAAAGLVGLLVYVHWYSFYGREKSQALAVGQPLPSFVLEDAAGNEVRSDDFVGSPGVLLFYRGNWCPLCMAQIKEIAGLYRQLDERGAKVRLVSPQPHDNTQALAKRFDVPFEFLVDPGSRAAKRLEILSPDGIPLGLAPLGYDDDTPMPTVVITDANGIILFCDETDNYRVRPEPETFLKVLDGQPLSA